MDEPIATDPPELAAKIARLVEERGWNQEEFARIARVNRHTARQILLGSADRSLRNSTILACARALGLSVSDLRARPLEKLLPLMRDAQPSDGEAGLRRLHDQATQPELVAWLERNPDRARRLSADDRDELLALQGAAGAAQDLRRRGFRATPGAPPEDRGTHSRHRRYGISGFAGADRGPHPRPRPAGPTPPVGAATVAQA